VSLGSRRCPPAGTRAKGARIRIRGNASLAQSNEPIIYVDGVRIDNSGSGSDNLRLSRLDDLNPEAIERIEVLKGAAAATLYGTEASSGVIQIFTKAGRTGAPEFTFALEQAYSQHNKSRYEPHAGFARSDAQAQILSDLFERDIRPYEVFEHNYWDEVFETGSASTASLTVSGGTELITYMFSGRMQRENGPLGFERAAGQSLIVPGFQNAQDINDLNNLTGSLSIFPFPGPPAPGAGELLRAVRGVGGNGELHHLPLQHAHPEPAPPGHPHQPLRGGGLREHPGVQPAAAVVRGRALRRQLQRQLHGPPGADPGCHHGGGHRESAPVHGCALRLQRG
jgi:TonB-dependent SusC/RagA subfamily outer membrane receptor